MFTDPKLWSVTLSHEVLEMIADPTVNIFAPGPSPDPADGGKWVLFTYEVGDPVERFCYEIDGVLVSDFVTPWYFSEGEGRGTRNDFLGLDVPSFGCLPYCHIQYFDLGTYQWRTYVAPGQDDSADARTIRNRAVAASMAENLAVGPRRPDDPALENIVLNYNLAAASNNGAAKPLAGDIFQISRSGRRLATQLV